MIEDLESKHCVSMKTDKVIIVTKTYNISNAKTETLYNKNKQGIRRHTYLGMMNTFLINYLIKVDKILNKEL